MCIVICRKVFAKHRRDDKRYYERVQRNLSKKVRKKNSNPVVWGSNSLWGSPNANPHSFIIGAPGSGKSTSVYATLPNSNMSASFIDNAFHSRANKFKGYSYDAVSISPKMLDRLFQWGSVVGVVDSADYSTEFDNFCELPVVLPGKFVMGYSTSGFPRLAKLTSDMDTVHRVSSPFKLEKGKALLSVDSSYLKLLEFLGVAPSSQWMFINSVLPYSPEDRLVWFKAKHPDEYVEHELFDVAVHRKLFTFLNTFNISNSVETGSDGGLKLLWRKAEAIIEQAAVEPSFSSSDEFQEWMVTVEPFRKLFQR